ncbi:MAG: DUF2905 domain-containing protein [Candidatus Omnitrophota bacterium]
MITTLGKFFIIIGIILIGIGIILNLGGKIPWFGKFPGDIIIEKKNFSFYFPITTCFLLSIILSFIIWFISRFLE